MKNKMQNISPGIFKLAVTALAVGSLGALAGCDSGSANPDNENNSNDSVPGKSVLDTSNIITKQIDATAGGRGASKTDPKNKYTYFDLDSGELVELTDAQALTNSEWDIAFKRTNFKLNGGVSGPGNVRGGIADAQDDFYDAAGEPDKAVFINASAETELPVFEAVSDLGDIKLSVDRNIPYIRGDGSNKGWWLYAGPPTHAISANPDQWWLIKSAAGDSYAKFNVTNIVQTSRDITLNLFIQDKTQTAFSSTATQWTAAIGAAGGSKCFDIDSASEVDCVVASADWDVKVEVVGQAWNIWTNAGASGEGNGGAFGPFDSTSIENYPSGALNINGTDIRRMYGQDSQGGTFKDNTWYAYDLQDNNKLWPNYRVYAIDTGTSQYKLQVLSFYNAAGTSGMIKFRYQRL